MIRPRTLWRGLAVTGWLVGSGLLLGGIFPLLRHRYPATCRLIRMHWFRGLARILTLQIEVRGQPSHAPCLWVANHVSWLDVVVLGCLAPVRFVAKAEVADWPLLGFLARRSGTLFVQREHLSTLVGTLEAIEAALKDGETVALFPEGTTTAGKTVLPFSAALFETAVRCQVTTQPIALSYADSVRPVVAFIGNDTFVASLLRVLSHPRIPVQVHSLSELAPSHRGWLARQARQAILAANGQATQNLICDKGAYSADRISCP